MTKEQKTLLSIDEQITHLKNKGIQFHLVSEKEAAYYLKNEMYFFKVYAYRKNFDTYKDGPKVGQYIRLDFGQFIDLATIDIKLRHTILQLALDIELSTKLKLLNIFEEQGEDGYQICFDYIRSLDDYQYNILRTELSRFSHSEYCSQLTRHYPLHLPKDRMALSNELPIWVLLEVVPFGRLVDFVGFCAKRYNDKKLKDYFYLLMDCKKIRNACAHENCILNNCRPSTTSYKPAYTMLEPLSSVSKISKSVRQKRMSNVRIRQIVTLLYIHKNIVQSKNARERAVKLLNKLSNRMMKNIDFYSDNDAVFCTIYFLNLIIEKWFTKV